MSERTISVTIKYGKGYDETWAVFKGTPEEIRLDIVDYFGFDRDSVAGLTLNQLVINATQVARGGGSAASTLGAVALPSAPAKSSAAPPPQPGDPWEEAEKVSSPAQQTKPEPNPIFELIEGCTTIPDLKKLWAINQAAFQDSAVMDAWKARGRALKNAA